MKIISMWSGPRNISTAIMYAFAQRKDTTVIDEPLYAHYLRLSGAAHPGREEVLASQNQQGNQALKHLVSHASSPVTFIKNMAHHWVSLDDQWLSHFHNIFLIRDPREMLPSLVNQIARPTLCDTALDKQVALFQQLSLNVRPPIIMDSKELLRNPHFVLKSVCDRLEIPFDSTMLSWNAGALKEDGVWAKYWYQNVHKSTGFAPYTPKKETFPGSLEPLLATCTPYYKFLYSHAIKSEVHD